MTVELIVIGKTDSKEVAALVEMYARRVNFYCKFAVTALPNVRNTRNLTVKQQRTAEGEAILRQTTDGDYVVLLDERGEEMRSVEFAYWLQKRMNSGVKRLVLVIGGPYGFSDEVYRRADAKLSLSRMTFSHQIVRAIFAEHLGIGGETKYFDATDGVHTAHIRRAQGPAGEIELGMINVSEIRSGDGWWFLNTGVPHYVEMVHDVDGIDVNGRGRGIRYDTGRFPQGTNVNFVEVTGNGAIRMRTYERGVEHETLACGTGATAAAIITNYALQHGTTKYRIQVPGGELIVGFTHEAGTQNYTNIRLTGPARRVFSGVFETDNF